MSKNESGNMPDPYGEHAGELVLKVPSKRDEYLSLIDRLIETSFAKAQSKYCKNTERISWIRAITALVAAGAAVLKDVDLDDIVRRLEKIEQEKLKGNEK